MADLVDLGWSEFFARQLEPGQDRSPARIVAEHRTIFRVAGEAGEFNAAVSGRLRHDAESRGDLPSVGDWVLVERPVVGSTATIHRVLERTSKFSRKAAGDRTDEQIVAANIDVVWIVTALDQDFSLCRIERDLALALTSGAAPAVVLSKSDLCGDVNARKLEVESIASGAPVLVTSAITRTGFDALLPQTSPRIGCSATHWQSRTTEPSSIPPDATDRRMPSRNSRTYRAGNPFSSSASTETLRQPLHDAARPQS